MDLSDAPGSGAEALRAPLHTPALPRAAPSAASARDQGFEPTSFELSPAPAVAVSACTCDQRIACSTCQDQLTRISVLETELKEMRVRLRDMCMTLSSGGVAGVHWPVRGADIDAGPPAADTPNATPASMRAFTAAPPPSSVAIDSTDILGGRTPESPAVALSAGRRSRMSLSARSRSYNIDDTFLPTLLNRLKRRYRNSASTWAAVTKFNSPRNEQECVALAEAVDLYREHHPRALTRVLEILCRRMAGVHLADHTGNWDYCDLLQQQGRRGHEFTGGQ